MLLKYSLYLILLIPVLSALVTPDLNVETLKIPQKWRKSIQEDMKGFPFPPNKSLDDYTLETNGKPNITLIISSWRSGSSFFGRIFHSVNGTYYHYEPMAHHGVRQIRKGPLASKAVAELESFMNCDYSSLNSFMEYAKNMTFVLDKNKNMWQSCTKKKLCSEPEFLSKFCKMYPRQLLKLVRLRLDVAGKLLESPEWVNNKKTKVTIDYTNYF